MHLSGPGPQEGPLGMTRQAQFDPRFTRVVTQLIAVGTASEKGAISASKPEPPAVTIW